MSADPRVSVCIPTFNHGRFLGEALRSVLDQDYQDYEVIVSDNASTDGTEAVVRELADERIRYLRNDRNIGMMENWNRAIQQSRGRYVKVLQADDALRPGALSSTVPILDADGGVGIVVGARAYIDEQGRPLGTKFPFRKEGRYRGRALIGESLIRRPIGNPSFVLLRRECFDRVGLFDPAVAPDGDLDMWNRILCFWDLYYLPKILASSRMHPGSHTAALVSSGTHIEESLKDIRTMLGKPGIRASLSRFDTRCAFGVFGVLAWIHLLGYARRGRFRNAGSTLASLVRHRSLLVNPICFGLWSLRHLPDVRADLVSTHNCLLAHRFDGASVR
ncbi:MAG TPA: glycosyltransferase [Vicinamibacteria bacterium]|jgi:glycosyltransferase involved in cell wall biosynthesis